MKKRDLIMCAVQSGGVIYIPVRPDEEPRVVQANVKKIANTAMVNITTSIADVVHNHRIEQAIRVEAIQ